MSADSPSLKKKTARTATHFFLRGLAISLPPILTLVILVWIGRGIYDYIINPISTVVQYSIAQFIDRSEPTKLLNTMPELPALPYCGSDYRISHDLEQRLQRKIQENSRVHASNSESTGKRSERTIQENGKIRASDIAPDELDEVYVPIGDHKRAVPYSDYALVAVHIRPDEMPRTVIGLYMKAATHKHFHGVFGISAFAVSLSIVLLYYLGRLVTSRLGAWGFQRVESVFLNRLPVVSNVYSSVKQVTDFLFSERTIEYNRVVAIEYPRRGIWSVGFVTGESMLEMTAAAGEPLISVLVPTSPMPVTGYTMNVPKNEVLDLNITIDQAFQYCLSCGVLVPPQQRVTPELLQQELTKRLIGGASTTPATRGPTRPAPLDSAVRRGSSGTPEVDSEQ